MKLVGALAVLLALAAAASGYDADVFVMTPGTGRSLQTETCRQPNNADAEQAHDPVQWLVQFSTVVTDATLRAFARVVPCVGGPQHFDAGIMVCVGDGSVLARALQFPGVLRVTERDVSDRVAPDTPDLGHYVVKCVADYCQPVMRALDRVRAVYRLTRTKLLVWPALRNLETLRQNPQVLSIEPKPQLKAMNAGARDVLTQGIKTDGYNRAESRTTQFLRGEGEIVAVADTGIDMNNCFFAQEGGAPPMNTVDYNRTKVIAVLSTSCTTCWGEPDCTGVCGDGADRNNGHGTHVAGSVAGRAPGEPQSMHNGMAPDAKLIMQDMEDQHKNFNVPSDVTELFEPAYNLGAKIHVNSWGCNGDGKPLYFCNKYDSNSAEIDAFAAEHEDFLILVAAGNDGTSAPSHTVGAPATCKNCLSVGATVLDPGQNVETIPFMNPYEKMCPPWDQSEPCCQTTEGCALPDCCGSAYGEDCCPETYETFKTSHLAVFSSTGPSRDGRFKPDLACPGQNIVSAHATKTVTNATFCLPAGDHGLRVNATSFPNRAAIEKGGTSMSTPLMAGSAALVREYFRKGFYPSGRATPEDAMNVTSALIRAVLIASASPLTAVKTQSGLKSTAELSPSVSPYAGFGVPSLDRVLWFADSPGPTKTMVINGMLNQTNNGYVYFISLNPGTTIPTTIALTWTDPAGRVNGTTQLINDLDLIVMLPGKEPLYGNGRLFADTLNNAERVIISPDGNVTATVVVRAETLRSDSQAFSLVANGAIISFGQNSTGHNVEYNTGRMVMQNSSSELVLDNKKCFLTPERHQMRFVCGNLPLQQHQDDSAVLEWRMHLATIQRMPLSSVQYNATSQTLCLGCNLGIVDDDHLRYQSPELVMSNVKAAAANPGSLHNMDPVLSRANWTIFLQAPPTTAPPATTTAVPPPPPPVSSSAGRLVPGLMVLLLTIVMRAYEL